MFQFPPELILCVLQHCSSNDISSWISWYRRNQHEDTLLPYFMDPSLAAHSRLILGRTPDKNNIRHLSISKSPLGVTKLHPYISHINLQGITPVSLADLQSLLSVCGQKLRCLDVGNGPAAQWSNSEFELIALKCPRLNTFNCSAFLTQFRGADYGIWGLKLLMHHCRLRILDISHHLRPRGVKSPHIAVDQLITEAKASRYIEEIHAYRCRGWRQWSSEASTENLKQIVYVLNAAGESVKVNINRLG
jgi:hypothetical protein